MSECPLFIELCAGTAAMSLRLHRARARPPVSRMGAKTGYADVLLGLMGLAPGQGTRDGTRYLWCEPDPGVRLLLEAYRDAGLARAAADIIRGWAGEDPRALWERLRAEGPPRGLPADLCLRWLSYGQDPDRGFRATAGGTWPDRPPEVGSVAERTEGLPTLPAEVHPDARAVEPREVARWLSYHRLTIPQAQARGAGPSDFNGGKPQGAEGQATDLEGLPCLPADIAPDARAVDPREVARWVWVQRRSANGKGADYKDGEGTHKIAPDAPAPAVRGLPCLPADMVPDAREVDPREVARWAFVTSRTHQGGGGYAPERYDDPSRTGWPGSGPPREALAARVEGVTGLPAGLTPDARTIDPGPCLPVGTWVFIDPPYVGTTGYGHDLPRAEVVTLARRWAEAGAGVMVTEAEAIPELVAEGWHAVEYDHGRVGQRRTFSKQQREVATMNRAPGRVDRLGRQGGLFG
jgi:hypothetical protein